MASIHNIPELNHGTAKKILSQGIEEFIDLLREDPNISPEKIAGMDFVVALTREFENVADSDIDAHIQSWLRANRENE